MNVHAASGQRWKPAPLDAGESAALPRPQGHPGLPSEQACRNSPCRTCRLARGATPERLRRPGGGRKPLRRHDPHLVHALEPVVDPVTRGDPMSLLRWTCKSAAQLAAALQAQGHLVSARPVNRRLHDLGYSLQSNRKTREGSAHPDREAPFHDINRRAKAFQQQGQPVVSVDTKKKELRERCRSIPLLISVKTVQRELFLPFRLSMPLAVRLTSSRSGGKGRPRGRDGGPM